MRVGEAARQRADLRPVVVLLVKGPAAILLVGDEIDSLVSVLPHVAAPQIARRKINGEAPRIAQTDGPHFGADAGGIDRDIVEARRAEVGIVRRNPVGGIAGVEEDARQMVWLDAAGFFVHINARDARKKAVVNALRVILRIVLVAAVPQRNVEITVRAEVQVAAVVVVGRVRLLEQHHLRRGVGGVGISRRHREARQPFVGHAVGRHGIIEVKIIARRKSRMEREAQQPLLAPGRNRLATRREHRREIEERAGRWRGRGKIRNHAEHAAFFADEHTVCLTRRGAQAERLVETQSWKRIDELKRRGGRRGRDVERVVREAQVRRKIDRDRRHARRAAHAADAIRETVRGRCAVGVRVENFSRAVRRRAAKRGRRHDRHGGRIKVAGIVRQHGDACLLEIRHRH